MARARFDGVRHQVRAIRDDNPVMFNIVAEIRGREEPEEVVIIGGHFDSFHAATGATDNGGNCAADRKSVV